MNMPLKMYYKRKYIIASVAISRSFSRLPRGCMTPFCVTSREPKQSCLRSTLPLLTLACTRSVAALFTNLNCIVYMYQVKQCHEDNYLQATNEVAAAVLGNEVDELKQTKVEGLSEDPEMRLESKQPKFWSLHFSFWGTTWLWENWKSSWTRWDRFFGYLLGNVFRKMRWCLKKAAWSVC